MIRHVKTSDARAICALYNYHVRYTTVTFEEKEVAVQEMEKRIESVISRFPWLVYEENNTLAGYAYATEWRTRSAYRYAAETTIYLSEEFKGKGIGYSLYQQLINELGKQRLHALIGGIALPNDASIALHEKLNFEKVAHFKEVGFKLDQWIDVGYWQLLLDHHSYH